MFAVTTRAIFRDVAEQRRAMNLEYDRQTNNGENEQEQSKWNIKIADLLAGLEMYNGNTNTINLR